MAVTAQQVFNTMMAVADELDESGSINPTDTNDYLYRTPSILNMLQARLLKLGDIDKKHEISHKPAKMAYGTFKTIEYDAVDELIYTGTSPIYGYYFEIDGEGTVYIEDYTGTWNVLDTIVTTSLVTDFTAQKGIVTPTPGATESRIRFTGTYRYLIKNIGLFENNFPLSRLPDYRSWVKKEMPSNFNSVKQIVNEYADNYDKDGSYKWEGKSDLYVSWNYSGNIRIVYKAIPDTITAITDTIQLDDVTAKTTLVYGLGMELYKNENPELYAHFKEEYIMAKNDGKRKQPKAEQTITGHYGGMEVHG